MSRSDQNQYTQYMRAAGDRIPYDIITFVSSFIKKFLIYNILLR